jgi:hypothetical protein
MSVSVLEDWDGSDEYEDITNQTQYAGGKGSNEFDDLWTGDGWGKGGGLLQPAVVHFIQKLSRK